MVLSKRQFQLGYCSQNVPDTNVVNEKEKDGFMAVMLVSGTTLQERGTSVAERVKEFKIKSIVRII